MSVQTTAYLVGMDQALVPLCHWSEEEGSYIQTAVAGAAVQTHRAHGDGEVGGPVPGVPGTVFDQYCGQVLFDNGSSSGSQSNNGNVAGGQELFEDFSLDQAERITIIRWQQHDHDQAMYVDTEVQIFAGLPYAEPPVFQSTVRATRTPNQTPTLFGAWEGYDYEVTGLSVDLPAGTYWLGLNSSFDGIRSGWDNTIGGPDTMTGFRLINFNFPAPGKMANGNLAFTIRGALP